MEAALRGAVYDVNGLGKGLDVTLRQVQFERRGDEKIPIHGGPGDPEGDFNAINVPWVAGEGYPNVPHGSSFVIAAHVDGSQVPRPAHDPHLLAVDQPVVAVLRRPDADVLAQGVGEPAASASARSSPTATSRSSASGRSRCTSRRAITYRLPLRKRERIRRVRATVNGKRVKVRRVGRRGVRVSLRGRPKGRYRIRVTAKTSRKRTIKLDRRARTCTPKPKGRSGEARAPRRARCSRCAAAAPAVGAVRPGLRGEQLLQDQRARGDPLHAGVQGAARAGQRRQHDRGRADRRRRPRALVRRADAVLELRRGLRGRRAALRLAAEGLRPGPARRVHRAQRRDALRAGLVHARAGRRSGRAS